MANGNPRRDLADRAAEIWKGGGVSYSEAVDQALAERNPTGNPTVGEKLLYTLLNVNGPVRWESLTRASRATRKAAAGAPLTPEAEPFDRPSKASSSDPGETSEHSATRTQQAEADERTPNVPRDPGAPTYA